MLYMYEKRKNPREDSKGEELLLCVSAATVSFCQLSWPPTILT